MNISDIQDELDKYSCIIGIDWADENHDVYEYNTQTEQGEQKRIPNTPAEVIDWLHQIKNRYDGEKILICIEKNDTSIMHTLDWVGFVEVVDFPTSTLSSFRETFTPSGAKNDPTDARLMVKLYLTHPTEFEVKTSNKQDTRMIGNITKQRRKLVDERGDLENKLRSNLKKYFPQALELVGSSLHSGLAIEFLKKWNSLEKIKQADEQKIREFYRSKRLREELIEERINRIKQAEYVTKDKSLIKPLQDVVKALIKAIEALTQSIKRFDGKLNELTPEHEDAFIWKSFPRAGLQMAPRLLAVWGDDRGRWERPEEMQTYSGMAPVTEDSGKDSWVHWRWNAPNFVKQTFYEYAEHSRQGSAWAEAFYEMKKDQGDDHQTAIRKLAYKWIRIMFRCWRDKIQYKELTYIRSLLRSDAEMVEYIDQEIIDKIKNHAA